MSTINRSTRPRSAVSSVILGMVASVLTMGTASAQEVLMVIEPEPSVRDWSLERFAAIGDVNGDGTQDFLYGASMAHRHRVRSGADLSTLAWYESTYTFPYFDSHGYWVAGLGLWDDDDVPDYAVTAPAGFNTYLYEGIVRVFSGATHTLILEITGQVAWERLGARVFGLGDLDGDGHSELATTGSTEYFLRIYRGPSGTLFREHSWLSFKGNAGTQVGSYGDWDGDGCDDYLIGECGSNYLPGTEGRVRLFSGRTGAELLSMSGRREHEYTGLSVCAAGDWNGDGIDDIAAGAPGAWDPAGGDICGVYVFSGVDGSILRYFHGAVYSDDDAAFGFAIDSDKDVNGDGFPDLIVGAPGETVHPPHWRNGALYVISGSTGAVLWRFVGGLDNDYQLGHYVYLIDDHDADGIDEWVVSDVRHETEYLGESHHWGRITIYRGAVGDRWDGCPTTPNSAGTGATLHASGPISFRCNELELSVTDTPPAAAAQLVYGPPGPATPFGAGTLCVAGTSHVATSVVTDATGAALFPIDLWKSPFSSGPAAIAIGETVAFQLLYRDKPAGTRNASNSIVIQFLP